MVIHKKIPAFTLIEVVIAMLIAAIAITITYTAYQIINGTYQGYIKKQHNLAAYTIADKLLKKDFQLARHMTGNGNQLHIELDSGLVNYEFKENFITRELVPLPVDTFFLPVKKVEFSFEKKVAGDETAIDELNLEAMLEGQQISLVYKKNYSAQDLFK